MNSGNAQLRPIMAVKAMNSVRGPTPSSCARAAAVATVRRPAATDVAMMILSFNGTLGYSQSVAYQAWPYQALPYQALPYQALPYQALPYQALPYQALPDHWL